MVCRKYKYKELSPGVLETNYLQPQRGMSIPYRSRTSKDTDMDRMVEPRDLDELQHRQNVLLALLESIRTGDQATVDRILAAVRSGRSRQEIIAALSEITGVTRDRQQSGSSRRN